MSDQFLTRNTLLQRAKDPKDEQAWEEFVSYYETFIFILLRQMNVPQQDCDDLTWHVKTYQGKLTGVIYLSDLAIMYKDEVTNTKASKLTLNNGKMKATIDFSVILPKKNMSREFSFAVPLYARLVIVMNHGSKASIRYSDIVDSSGIVNLINPPDVEMHRTKIN